MSFNFHNHKQRQLVTEEKPISYVTITDTFHFINSDAFAFQMLDQPGAVPTLAPPGVRPRTVEQQLIEGRAKIDQGWVKGMWSGRVANRMVYCARGAVAYGPGEANHDAEGYLARALPEMYQPYLASYHGRSEPGNVVAFFNDNSATTHQDVLDLFDRAIGFAHQEAA